MAFAVLFARSCARDANSQLRSDGSNGSLKTLYASASMVKSTRIAQTVAVLFPIAAKHQFCNMRNDALGESIDKHNTNSAHREVPRQRYPIKT